MGYTNTPVSAIREFTVCDAKGWDCMGPHANDVHPNLAEFVNELRRAAPWLRFAVDRVIPYIREVYVYMDNHEYALGRVGYGDYAIRDTNTVYMVSSRNIKNGKVADWRRRSQVSPTIRSTPASGRLRITRSHRAVTCCPPAVARVYFL